MGTTYIPEAVGSGVQTTSTLNDNFTNIQTALAASLSRNGTSPNAMAADLDMDSNDILNAASISTVNLTLNGQTVAPTALSTTPIPDQTGNAGKILTTNGSAIAWDNSSPTLDLRYGTTFITVAAMVAASPVSIDGVIVIPVVGMVLHVVDYATGSNSGFLTGTVVAAATGTPDGGSFINLNNGLQWKQNFKKGEREFAQFGVVADGIVDDTVAVKACIAATEAIGGRAIASLGDIRLTSTVNIVTPIEIVGIYPQPYIGGVGVRGKGSWFHFDHTGVGFNIDGPAIMGTVFLDKFGTFRTQPTPAPAWVPTDHDFDIVFNDTDLVIGDLMLYNPTKGIKGTNGNAGRLTIGRLRGQPLNKGIDLDQQFDAPNIGQIHFWPFWQDNSNVHDYTLLNLDALFFKRVDNPFIRSIFTIFARAGLRISEAANGTTNKFRIDNADFDGGNFGIWIDSTSISGTRGQIGNLSIQGKTDFVGSKGVFFEGTNAQVDISNLDIRFSDQNGIRINGTTNLLRISQLVNENFNRSGSSFPAVEVSAGSTVRITGMPSISGDGGTGGRYGGAGLIYVDEWRDFTPTITSTSGTITTLGTVTGRFKRHNNTLDFEVDLAITTNGTGSGAVRATLPDTITTQAHVAVGRETLAGGKQLSGTLFPATAQCDLRNFDNSYPGSDGSRLVVSGSYRIA